MRSTRRASPTRQRTATACDWVLPGSVQGARGLTACTVRLPGWAQWERGFTACTPELPGWAQWERGFTACTPELPGLKASAAHPIGEIGAKSAPSGRTPDDGSMRALREIRRHAAR